MKMTREEAAAWVEANPAGCTACDGEGTIRGAECWACKGHGVFGATLDEVATCEARDCRREVPAEEIVMVRRSGKELFVCEPCAEELYEHGWR